jgi:4-hydroxybenzoate polyprenyltransferase
VAYLKLLRLPTVFTAWADVVLGFLLTHRSFEPLDRFLWLLAATTGLYLSGMVFNDMFDRRLDAVERPERPIPSGQVSVTAAGWLGGLLMLGGVVCAAMVGSPSLYVALLLASAILAYDAMLKPTWLGPIGMGACRFLNVMLAASDYGWWFQLWARPQLVCALGLGVYIIGVTWFARSEAGRSSRTQLIGGLATLLTGVGVLAALVLTWPNEGRPELVLLLMAFIAGSLAARVVPAIRHPSPAAVQMLVKLMLLNYVMLAAALVYWHTANGAYAFGTALLVLPAMILSRVIPMT